MTELTPFQKMSRDMRAASQDMTINQARFLVDMYYMMQEQRKRSGNQVKALAKSEEPHAILHWFGDQFDGLEGQIRGALDRWTDSQPVGQWLKSVTGIGPVIAAGL